MNKIDFATLSQIQGLEARTITQIKTKLRALRCNPSQWAKFLTLGQFLKGGRSSFDYRVQFRELCAILTGREKKQIPVVTLSDDDDDKDEDGAESLVRLILVKAPETNHVTEEYSKSTSEDPEIPFADREQGLDDCEDPLDKALEYVSKFQGWSRVDNIGEFFKTCARKYNCDAQQLGLICTTYEGDRHRQVSTQDRLFTRPLPSASSSSSDGCEKQPDALKFARLDPTFRDTDQNWKRLMDSDGWDMDVIGFKHIVQTTRVYKSNNLDPNKQIQPERNVAIHHPTTIVPLPLNRQQQQQPDKSRSNIQTTVRGEPIGRGMTITAALQATIVNRDLQQQQQQQRLEPPSAPSINKPLSPTTLDVMMNGTLEEQANDNMANNLEWDKWVNQEFEPRKLPSPMDGNYHPHTVTEKEHRDLMTCFRGLTDREWEKMLGIIVQLDLGPELLEDSTWDKIVLKAQIITSRKPKQLRTTFLNDIVPNLASRFNFHEESVRYLKRFGRPTFRIVNPFIGIKLLRSIYKLLSLAQVNKLFQKQFGIVLLKTDNLTNWEDWEREFFYSIHRHEFTEMMDQEHVSHALTIMDALNYNLAAF
ncbi:hypothetical protein Fcan01_18103, partial [Folsomia candida]